MRFAKKFPEDNQELSDALRQSTTWSAIRYEVLYKKKVEAVAPASDAEPYPARAPLVTLLG